MSGSSFEFPPQESLPVSFDFFKKPDIVPQAFEPPFQEPKRFEGLLVTTSPRVLAKDSAKHCCSTAIFDLEQQLRQKDAEIAYLRNENADLKHQVNYLKQHAPHPLQWQTSQSTHKLKTQKLKRRFK